MSDVTQETRRVAWPEYFSFVHIFRAFRLAIQPTKLFLAFCCVFGSYLTGRILDGVWPAAAQPLVIITPEGQQSELDVFTTPEGGRRITTDWVARNAAGKDAMRVGAFKLLLNHCRSTVNAATIAVAEFNPIELRRAAKALFLGLLWLIIFHPVFAVLFLLASLAIWSLFGGALCRVAAVHAAKDERIDLREALRFAAGKFASFFAAPLMPIGLVVLFGLMLFVGGLIGAIPAVGEILVGIFFFLALVAGLVIAFIAIGAVAGFPMMFPIIATEGSDAFDALSRSFSYVYQRPWRTGFYVFVSTVYGAICLLFVKLFVRLAMWAVGLCAGISMNWGSAYVNSGHGGAGTVGDKLHAIWQSPRLTGGTTFWGGFGEYQLAHFSWFAQLWFFLWVFIVVGIVAAYLVSFFFSSSTLIYLLLRRETDGENLDVVFLETPEGPELPPTGDVAAKKDDQSGAAPSPDAGTS